MGLLDGGDGGAAPTPGPGLPGLPGLPSLSLPPILPSLSLPMHVFIPTGPRDPGSSSSAPPSSSSALPSSSLPESSSAPASESVSPSPSSASPPPTSPPPASPSSTGEVVTTEPNGVVKTLINTVFETAPATNTDVASPPAKQQSFLQNKALSGTVFALSGLVAVVLIVIVVTWVFRRRRRNRLLDDAVSFDPSLLATADQYDGSEKGHGHSANPSLGSLANPHSGYGSSAYHEPAQYGGAPYGGAAQYQQQAYYAYYSSYVPPMTDAPAPGLAGTAAAAAPAVARSTSRGQHNIPRVPVPPSKALPEEFGRGSVEDSEFWSKTLKCSAKEQHKN
ncbi:hypothetical protein R3P38DRAFT_2830413 [Favolaschia claudopus]|uniref:Uncharacterized protein n=1 Tax=Favolaschia claudopus TaxID=2862362 RepID=A0AAW0E7X1_9AGAR